MKGLILKDFYNLRTLGKSWLFSMVVILVFGFSFQNVTYTTLMIIFLALGGTFSLTTYDDMANWQKYALSTPLTSRELVKARYIVSFALLIGGCIMAVALGTGFALAFKTDLAEMLWASGMLILIAFILISCLLPLIYKIGADKSRYVIMAGTMTPALAFLLIYRYMVKAGVMVSEELLRQLLIGLLVGAVVLALLAPFVSYRVCLRILDQKEW